MRWFWLHSFLVLSLFIEAQNTLLCRVSPDETTIQLKWYCQPFISPEGYTIYRRELNGAWERLNTRPVKHKDYVIPAEVKLKDKELTSYQNMASDPNNIKDVTLLASVIKSFKSDEFSRYLGIRFDDTNFSRDKRYEYKLTTMKDGVELELATSKAILAGHFQPETPIQEVQYKTSKRKVAFVWKPETDRYFGTEIYRRTGDTGTFQKITKDPILLSKTKRKDGTEDFGNEFFVDKELVPGTKYYYQFVAVDFFGTVARPSEIVEVIIKDLEAPMAPDSLYKFQKGRLISLHWKKRLVENDLAGYNIYRTTNNDTDYVQINSSLIPSDALSYQDSVPAFGSYMYKVSAVDKDQNTSFSNPYFMEIYDDEPPLSPKGLIVSSDTGILRLRWDKSTEDDLEGYLVYRTINTNNADAYVKLTPVPVKNNFYEERLPQNTKNKFLYKIVAVDKSLNRSPYSDFVAARMPDIAPPNAPFLRTAYANEKNQILVEWFASSEPDLMGYHLFRKISNDTAAGFEKINAKPVPVSSFRYVDRSTEPGVSYEYYLVAFDSTGNNSWPSNHLRHKIKVDVQENVSVSRFEARYDKKKQLVTLKWKISEDTDVKGVVLYKQSNKENTFSPLTGLMEETAYKDKDVSTGGDYVYQLRAYNKKGDVFKSEILKIKIEK